MKRFKLFLLLFTFSMVVVIGCSKAETKLENTDPQKTEKSALIRDKKTDVKLLDLNKDGKLFQCPMKIDYEVISDKLESCPKCKMDLEETSVEDAQKNLSSK